MPLKFNSVLSLGTLDPADVVLLRHQDGRASRGRTPYELWRDNRPAFDIYQSTQGFGHRSRLERATHWASFVGAPNGQTMFVGMYCSKYLGVLAETRNWAHADGIHEAGSCDTYDLVVVPEFDEFAGKLIIDWGDGARAWIQRADRQNKAIVELRPEFKEAEFPGYLNFIAPLSKIETLPASWISALKASGGIYLLTCPQTKEQYVGMADGMNGFWQRWRDYVQTGHGNNVALKSRPLSDYQVSILEVAGTSVETADIAKMEQLWKRKLQSQEMGLNRN